MTKFYTYNIQLLPNDNSIREVGKAGYKKLFRLLYRVNARHRREKTLQEFHHRIAGDVYIGPDRLSQTDVYLYGYFVKYTKTDRVKNLNNRTTVFENSGRATTVSKDEDVPFVFDTQQHYLCIEGGSVLTALLMVEALEKFLKPIASENFPDHELKINSVSEPRPFESILQSAIGFKTINVRATFENGHDNTQNVLKQLKDSKTKTINLNASGGDGVINKLPSFIEELARAAVVVGAITMTYYVAGNSRKQTYDSKESPLAFAARWTSEDDETSFFSKVHEKLLKNVGVAEESAHRAVEQDHSNQNSVE